MVGLPLALSFAATVTAVTFQADVEYPLAVQFISAHPNNYVPGGIIDHQYVIIHQQDGYYDGTISHFQNPTTGVSTHYVMRASDGEITQMVRHADAAQHIGSWNPYSFGIEHEGLILQPGWYTWETYVASAQLTRWLCDHYDIPIDRDHILGHVEVPGGLHADPGEYFDWDMYMAMIHDVVPEGRVEGVVVDRSRACTITATADTWITTTLESLDALDEGESCHLPAGTELEYLHASPEMISQRRLTMAGGGPCAGLGTLDEEAYLWMPSFTAPCDPQSMAATGGVTVELDGVAAPVDVEGRFVFEGVAAGPHTIDVETDGTYVATAVPIDIGVYPGMRVVIALDPGNDPGDPTTAGSDTSGGESSSGAEAGDDGSRPDPEPDEEESGEPSDDDGGSEGGVVPGRASANRSDGCSCRIGHATRDAAALLLLLFARTRRRRSA